MFDDRSYVIERRVRTTNTCGVTLHCDSLESFGSLIVVRHYITRTFRWDKNTW